MIALESIKKLSKEELPLLTLVTGEDQGQYTLLKEALLNQIAFDKEDLAYSYFDLSETPFEQVAMDLESLPFFADTKIVILDAFTDLTTSKKTYLDEKQLKAFEAYVSQPLETNRLVIFAPGKLDGKRRLVKLLKRDATIFEATELKEAELRTYFQKQAHDMGLSFASGAFDALIQRSNANFSDTYKNLIFLKNYLSQGQVSLDLIADVLPKSLQDNVFDLTQFIITGRIDQANQLLRDLRLQGEDDVKLIAIMLSQLRLYLQVKLLTQSGKGEQQMVSILSEKQGRRINPYQLKFALRDSRPLSISFLKHALLTLIETDYQIKSGLFNKDYLFEVALLKIQSRLSH